MNTKHLIGIFLILSATGFAGCSNNDDTTDDDAISGFRITSIEYGIDAVQKEIIRAALEKHEPFPVGSYFFPDPFGPNLDPGATGTWCFRGVDGKVIANETYKVNDKIPPAYFRALVPIEKPIYNCTSFHVGGDTGINYYLFLIFRGGETGNSSPTYVYMAVYEDLTEYYKTEYPGAGVNNVVRAYIFDYWSSYSKSKR